MRVSISDIDACWEWQSGRTTAGYGSIDRRVDGKKVKHYAHRLAYELFHGVPEPGNVVMHTCDNPPCVNPRHLRQGSYRDNTLDMYEKGRARPGAGRQSLNTQQVIRLRRTPYYVGMYQDFAKEFNVSINTVSQAALGVRYKWIDEPPHVAPKRRRTFSKLTDEQVREIRALPYSYGLYARLSKEYGVYPTNIRNAYKGITYQDVK